MNLEPRLLSALERIADALESLARHHVSAEYTTPEQHTGPFRELTPAAIRARKYREKMRAQRTTGSVTERDGKRDASRVRSVTERDGERDASRPPERLARAADLGSRSDSLLNSQRSAAALSPETPRASVTERDGKRDASRSVRVTESVTRHAPSHQEPPTPPRVAKLDPIVEIFAASELTRSHAYPLALQLSTLETTCGRPPSITLVDVARETLAELAIAGSKVRDVETYAGRIARDLLAPGRLEAKRKEREAKGVAKAGGTSTSPSVVRKPVIFG